MTNNEGELPTNNDSSDKTFNKIEGVARIQFYPMIGSLGGQ